MGGWFCGDMGEGGVEVGGFFLLLLLLFCLGWGTGGGWLVGVLGDWRVRGLEEGGLTVDRLNSRS